jgi:hypothetical protein
MDEKTKLLVSLGPAVAAGCPPTLPHSLGKKEAVGLTPNEIREDAEIADQAKTQPRRFMQRNSSDCSKRQDGACFALPIHWRGAYEYLFSVTLIYDLSEKAVPEGTFDFFRRKFPRSDPEI